VGTLNAVAGGSAWRETMRRSHVHTLKRARKKGERTSIHTQIHRSINPRFLKKHVFESRKRSNISTIFLLGDKNASP
jgi:hypothetical protein